MHKQIKYDSPTESSLHNKLPVNPLEVNNRYANYNQTIFTAGDVDQFLSKLSFKNDDIINTFHYIYHKFKKGIFIHIINNKLHTFLPFSKFNYINEWHDLLDKNNIKLVMKNLYKYDWDPSHWYANNFILRNEYPQRQKDSGICQLYDMFDNLCKNHKIKDCYFFVNKRDFPLLKQNRTEPYNAIFGDNTPLISHHYNSYAPILSMSSNQNFDDIPIPTWDDWTNIQCINHQKYFSKPCINRDDITNFCCDWKQKKNIAVFRGSSTGNGTNIHNNLRMKLCNIDSNLIDAGITNWNNRPRLIRIDDKLMIKSFFKHKKSAEWLTPKQQSHYKYIINIEGHSRAFRLSLEMNMMSVILLVDCDYDLWFTSKLEEYKHYVPVKRDLSDLIEKIEWCRKNDKKCKEIAMNAKNFYDCYLSEKGVYDYLRGVIKNLSQKSVRKIEYDDTRITKKLINHFNKEPIYSRIIKCNQNNIFYQHKNITKFNYANYNYVKKKTNPHEAFVSIFCVNIFCYGYKTNCDNFVTSFCYHNNHLYLDNVEGNTFQEWICSKDFNLTKYDTYMKKIANIINFYQNTYFKFVHYDLSPWNIIINKDDELVFIDYEKSYCEIDDTPYHPNGPYEFCSIIDVLSILIKSLNTILNNTQFKHIRFVNEDDTKILLKYGNFVSKTKYRPKPFTNLYELKQFVNNMSKYDNLLFMPKYELKNMNPQDFLNYLKLN